MDTVTLQYRDKLRNAMRESDFRALQWNVQKTFASSLLANTVVITLSPSAGEIQR
ncbi:hypothetical protein [Tunturiibacter gelidiferens]|uniref:Uncharacterized protein n=1 Tax=Tunturiibacter gelidiferens TaxID=3069689 RepID=A0AAU7Z3U8_9BACT